MDFIKIERKETLMEQIKKVKIVTKMTLLSVIQTLWAIGTSVVAGDVLTQRLESTNRQQAVIKHSGFSAILQV